MINFKQNQNPKSNFETEFACCFDIEIKILNLILIF